MKVVYLNAPVSMVEAEDPGWRCRPGCPPDHRPRHRSTSTVSPFHPPPQPVFNHYDRLSIISVHLSVFKKKFINENISFKSFSTT